MGKAFQNHYRLDAAVPRRPPLDSSFVDQLRNLVAAIRHEQEVLVNGHEGMAAVEVVRRAYTGKPSSLCCAIQSPDLGKVRPQPRPSASLP